MLPTPPELEIDVVVSPLFDENCYLVRRAGSQQAVVIDPGLDPEQIAQRITDLRLEVAGILNTHGHADHIAGNEFLKRCWPAAPLIIGTGDAPKLADPVLNLSAPFGLSLTSPPPDRLVNDGDQIELGGLQFEVRETPGHSVGHVVFIASQSHPIAVFGGDVLFRESVGRTDFPDGDATQLATSIRNRLYTLPDPTIVYPGHGPATTIGHERQANPFVPDGV